MEFSEQGENKLVNGVVTLIYQPCTKLTIRSLNPIVLNGITYYRAITICSTKQYSFTFTERT